MEELVNPSTMIDVLAKYSGKKILITGHTGFKGTWLSRILIQAGAEVHGLALEAEPQSLFARIENIGLVQNNILDIRNRKEIETYFSKNKFDGIFHLAAQPIVLRSFQEPVETFNTNVMGTAHILNAVINFSAADWVVVVTTDKVYKNVEKNEGYVEDEALGGRDPYSASKAATEMVVSAWNTISQYRNIDLPIHTVRSGNVIGGGDSSEDRLFPDLIRGFTSYSRTVIRNPDAVRPWQHVLDPLSGYLIIGAKLIEKNKLSSSFNFGPGEDSRLSVAEMANYACSLWEGNLGIEVQVDPTAPHESKILWLSSELATKELAWNNKFEAYEAIQWTINWEREAKLTSPIAALDKQIESYFRGEK